MITLSGFIGEIPKVASRLLPDSAAQLAKNCKLINGSIVPIRYPRDYRVLLSGNISFYKSGDKWFEYNKIIDVVKAPIAEDRLYFTGDGAPKLVIDTSIVYDLAVRAPAEALTASVTGEPDATTQETISYCYTYVTATDEESPPSPLSNEVTRSSGMEVTLTNFKSPTANRNFDRIRIYRSQTSASGATALYFIAEVQFPIPTSYIDEPELTPIQETISSLYADPPPDDLQGIISLPNGMMAAFTGNKLYISEPWKPHQWPEKYALTTSFDIVGLGAFGRSIAILTTGSPYVASGITPDAMAMELLEVNYPCLSKRGIVDLGYAVAYPSTDGLVVISARGAELVTKGLLSREQWQNLNPQSMIASQFEERYIVTYSYVDNTNATQQGMLIIDLTGEQPFLTRVDIFPSFMFFEVGAGKMYYLDGQNVREWDATTTPYMQATWKSKTFILDGHINLGAVMIDSDVPAETSSAVPAISINNSSLVSGSFGSTVVFGTIVPQTVGSEFQATVYADGAAIRTFTDLNKVARLPGGFMARTWEVQVTGRRVISSIYLAWAPNELYVGAR